MYESMSKGQSINHMPRPGVPGKMPRPQGGFGQGNYGGMPKMPMPGAYGGMPQQNMLGYPQ